MKSPQMAWLWRLDQVEALSVPAWMLVGVPSLSGSVVMLSLAGSASWESVGLSLLSWLAMGAVWWASREVLTRRGVSGRIATWVVGIFAVASLIRAVLLFPIIQSWLFLVVGFVYLTLLSVLFAIFVESMRRHRIAVSRLRGIRAALKSASERVEYEAEVLRQSITEVVLSALESALRDAQDPREAAVRLKGVTEDVVRPMSHDLARKPSPKINIPIRRPRGLQWRILLSSVLDSNPCHPVLTTSVFVLAIIPPLSASVGSERGFLAILAVASATWMILVASSAIPWRRLPIRWAFTLLPIVFIMAGGCAYITVRWILVPETDAYSGGVFAVGFLLLVGMVVALMIGLDRLRPVVQERLIIANTELAGAVGAANARLRRERRRLARVLHGVVQPRLVARAIEQHDRDGVPDFDQLLLEVTDLLSGPGDQQMLGNLREVLADLQQVWSVSTEIDIDVAESVDRAISHDPSLGQAVCEVVCEAVHNAVLRGGAEEVRIYARVALGEIRLVVSNPSLGSASLPLASSGGLGTDVFDEATDSWSLSTRAQTVVFEAAFSVTHGLTQSEQNTAALHVE